MRPSTSLPLAAGLCGALFAFAFVAAPKSCEWGLSAYFWVGSATLAALFAVPWVMRPGVRHRHPALQGAGYAALGLLVWIAGLFAADVRILCRLF